MQNGGHNPFQFSGDIVGNGKRGDFHGCGRAVGCDM